MGGTLQGCRHEGIRASTKLLVRMTKLSEAAKGTCLFLMKPSSGLTHTAVRPAWSGSHLSSVSLPGIWLPLVWTCCLHWHVTLQEYVLSLRPAFTCGTKQALLVACMQLKWGWWGLQLSTFLLYRSAQLIEAAGAASMMGPQVRPCAWPGCPQDTAHTLCPAPPKTFLSLESLSLSLAAPESFMPCLSQEAAADVRRTCSLLCAASL